MEDKDLPEIGFKEKEKEKKGFLPWLWGRGAAGSRGAIGSAGAPPAAGVGLGAGRALGAARFGAAGKFGAAGILASKSTIATVAVVAMAIGATLYVNDQRELDARKSSFSSDGAQPQEYVPAILRRQAAPGSSLDMFADRNKGAIGFDGETAGAAKAAGAEAAAEAKAEAGEEAPPADNAGMANPQDVLGRLQGASATGLSNQIGGAGGSGRMMMGGLKTGQGAFGPKVGFSDMGAGKFAPMQSPGKGKVTAMAAQKQAVRGGKSAAAAKKSKGAWNQAQGVRDVQKQYSATSIDGMRSTQDKAWEGATGDGGVDGGAGLGTGDGGAGVVTSPSLDNASSGGGSGDYGTPSDYNYEDPGNRDITPWAGLASTALMLILLSAVLSAIGGVLVKSKLGWVVIIGKILCAIAIALGVAAIAMGAMIISKFGQGMLGGIYVIGGGVAVLAGVAALSGDVAKAIGITPLWLSAIAGILGLLGSMMNGPSVPAQSSGGGTQAASTATPGGGGSGGGGDGGDSGGAQHIE